ncbi:hypothetical protein [Limnobacter sp.]|uniref:hypothetical protein n=1 Tax=Limnobacter sp. TaxID=2003368 RepID=UPI002736DF63|nr:hypothetical protein [Limnobacter sp.]MDP3188203.1 hypothetical protein [Limnobacter sp.]
MEATDAQATLESFVRNWSQFEILVDKQYFPIKAPNCKQTIQIRFQRHRTSRESGQPNSAISMGIIGTYQKQKSARSFACLFADRHEALHAQIG